MSGSPDVPDDWYDGFFEGDWLDQIALHADPERTQEQVEFIVEKLALEPEARVLDLACGHGRITLALARRGYRMTGLDLSPRSLELAREAAAQEGLEVDWVHADMREIPAGAGFDAIVNVFTSFGYFQEEPQNQRVLDGVARALAPSGRFLIDVVNLLGLTRRYRERMWEEREGVVWLQEHDYEILAGRNRAVWTFVRPDGSRSELVHSLRTYAPHELAAMLRWAGLEVEGAWGGFDGSELSFDSWRLILLARKP
jgi:cyclopropane fatty-acyl-phospholipid synthase-like methyltransferase